MLGRMRWRWAFGLFLLGLLGGSSPATAHEDAPFHLGGARLCVDPASVQVALALGTRQAGAAAAYTLLRRDLTAMLTATLARSGVTYRIEESCAGAADYTLLKADVRYLDPATYLGFGRDAHNYNLFVQVGGYDAPAAVARNGFLPTYRYTASLSEIYTRDDTDAALGPFVVGEGEKLVGALTAFWWEDNPRLGLRAALLPPLLGTVLALVSGGVVWSLLRRRRVRAGYGASG